MNTAYRSQMGEVMVKTGRMKKEDAAAMLEEARESNVAIETLLLKNGLLKKDEIAGLLEKYFNVPFIHIDETAMDKDLLKIVPEEMMRAYGAVAVARRENELTVALCFPNDIIAIDDIQIITGYTVKPVVASEENIRMITEKFYASDEMGKVIGELFLGDISSISVAGDPDLNDLKEAASRAPVVKLVDTILSEAVRVKASDIHIEPQEKAVFVRYRIDGILHTKERIPKEVQLAMTSRMKVLADMNITERRLPQDGQAKAHIQKRDIDFRVSTLPAKYGEKIVVRVLDKTNFALGLEHMGFMPDTQTKFEDMLGAGSGILLVTGPTGSGKTTTLYSALNRIKSSSKNIITLEDPIEYDLLSGKARESGITQVQINPRIGFTFASALRACLRQDPNVILVGEIRDEETCRIATNAALMGHLVLSTIHTNDAVSTITRLLDMGIEPYLIASSLNGVLAQRLVRVLCRNCREAYTPPKKVLQSLNVRQILDVSGDIVFYRPRGCELCDGSGYAGRAGIFELLAITETIRDLILEKAKLSILREAAAREGTISMKQNGIQLVSQGATTMAEVMRVLPTL